MENKQQTALEWLEQQIKQTYDNEGKLPIAYTLDLVKQAKQIEKEQIINARLDGFKISAEGWNGEYPYEGKPDKNISSDINNEQYYNEKYNK